MVDHSDGDGDGDYDNDDDDDGDDVVTGILIILW